MASLNSAITNAKDGDTIKVTGSITGSISLSKLVHLDLNGQTLTGNVSITSNTAGVLNISAGTITGTLTVDTKNATVNNAATVNDIIDIKDVATGTWNENADNNKIVVNDSTGITLNIASGKKVRSLTLNETATVTVGKGATFTNPVDIKKDSTIISKETVPAIIANNVKVTVKANKEEVGTTVIGTGSQEPVDLVLEAAVNTAVEEAEKAIKALPIFKDIRIGHQEAVLNAKTLVEKVKEFDPNAKVAGEEKVAEALEKIGYLENEKSSTILFTQDSPKTLGNFNNPKVKFEGYFYGAKYLEKVLIGEVEAELKFVPDFKNGPAFKYSKEKEYESGYYEEKIYGISQSGQQTNTTARFFVDTIKPTLEIKKVDKDNKFMDKVEGESVEIEVTASDNFYALDLYHWGNHELIQEDPGNKSLAKPANVTKTITVFGLELGENNVDFILEDAAGNKTEKTITITRVQSSSEVANKALGAIQTKITAIVNADSATTLTNAVKNAELVKIQELQIELDKVQTNTIPASWISQMLVDAGDDIVGFFTTGIASDRTTVDNAIANQVSVKDKSIIMGVYDKLVAALSAAPTN